ncbi:T9SS type A sorting domain-containing protein [Wenyingzhuangia sp. IMCC45574]
MFKKLLFSLALGAVSSLSYGQYVESFDGTAPTITDQNQGHINTPNTSSDRFESSLVAYPAGTTGGDNSTNVMQVKYTTSGAFSWYASLIATTATPVKLSDGQYISILYMPGEVVTNGTINISLLYPNSSVTPGATGNSNFNATSSSFSTTSATEWVSVTFDITGFPADATGTRVQFSYPVPSAFPHTRYIDAIQQSATLSFKSPQKDLSGAVSPNPVEDILTVNVEGAETYKLVNTVGQTVLEQKATGSINVSGLTSGLYILVTEKGTAKVIVK